MTRRVVSAASAPISIRHFAGISRFSQKATNDAAITAVNTIYRRSHDAGQNGHSRIIVDASRARRAISRQILTVAKA